MALPLQALTGKRKYQWGEEHERVFDELRKAMVRAPVQLHFLLKQSTFFGLHV
jgi:hypothetical protein